MSADQSARERAAPSAGARTVIKTRVPGTLTSTSRMLMKSILRSGGRLAATLAMLGVAACTDGLVVDPAPGPTAASISLRAAAPDGSPSRSVSGQQQQSDALWVRVSEVQGDEILETIVDLAPTQEQVTLHVPIPHPDASIMIEVEIRTNGQPLRRGQTVAQLSPGEAASVVVSTSHVVAEVEISPDPAEVMIGDTVHLDAVTRNALGEVITGPAVTWSSSATQTATVSGSGVVTGVGVGSAAITASSGDASTDVVVTVTRAPVASVTVAPSTHVMTQDETVQLAAILRDASGNELADRPIQWTSSNTAVATVNSSGLVTGLEVGTVTITATSEEVSGTATVTVEPSYGAVTGYVTDASTGSALEGAAIRVLDGTGGEVAMGTSSSSGSFYVEAPPGTYSVSVSATGFITDVTEDVGIVSGGDTDLQQIVLSRLQGEGETQMVLTWGETPSDLDSHLTGPDGQGSTFHVYHGFRGSLTSTPFAFLDVDDTSGFGPETMTIAQQFEGTYCYYIYNFSGSPDISTSGASVDVMQNNAVVETFSVPTDQTGAYWTVFSMSGSTITPINSLGAGPAC